MKSCWRVGSLFGLFVFVFWIGILGAQEPTPTTKEVILERAERIQYDSKEETFVASGQVIALQGKNRIQCEELFFDLKENRGTFQGQVLVTREKTEIRSQRMEGDFDTEIYQFQNQVELKKEREEKEEVPSFIFWKAVALSYNGKNEEAWSEGGVEISWKEITIKADTVHYFPKGENQEERMLLEGQVHIIEKNRELEVAKAIYYLDSETLDAEEIIRGRFLIEKKE